MTDLMSIGGNATLTYKKALSAVSNNIANLNTEGYSLQKIQVVSDGMQPGFLERSHDVFAEASLRSAHSSLSSEKPAVQYAGRLLNLIGSESGALTAAFDEFFSSSHRLATDPSSDALRQDYMSSAGFLTSRVKTVATDIQSIILDNNSEVGQRVSELNGLSSQLALIHNQLTKSGGHGTSPELLDKRDVVLMKMSELAKIDVSFDEIGRATVNLHNPNTGAVLVDNRGAKELGVVAGSSPKNAQSIVYTANDSTLNTIVGGKLGGLVAVRSTIIDPLVANLNSMVNTFVNRANSQHKAGINAAGAVGVSLFSVGSDGNHAENMTLAISSSDQISAAGRLKVAQGAANTAGIGVTLSYGQDSSWNNTIESNFSVTFTGATTYNITQSGSTTGYTGFNINNGITFGDVKIDFDKAPATSDSFAISSNAGGIGDNANIKMITGIRAEQIFSGKTLRNYYIDEVGKVANYSQLTGMSSEAKQAVYDQAVRTKDQQSGVNLDEEAAELIRLQQAFQASAKMLQTARDIFDSIIAIR